MSQYRLTVVDIMGRQIAPTVVSGAPFGAMVEGSFFDLRPLGLGIVQIEGVLNAVRAEAGIASAPMVLHTTVVRVKAFEDAEDDLEWPSLTDEAVSEMSWPSQG